MPGGKTLQADSEQMGQLFLSLYSLPRVLHLGSVDPDLLRKTHEFHGPLAVVI